MSIQSWFIYLALVMVATSTPGPAVLFITTNSTLHGWKKAVFAALGNVVGLFCLGLIAVTGLGSALKASEIIFDFVKYAGAIYLIYLGLRMFFLKNEDFIASQNQCKAKNVSSQKIFLQAFGVAVSNPKAIIFLTALFPQFININEVLIPQFITLITTLMFFSFCFLMLYALLAYRATIWIRKTSRMRAFNRTSGTVFIGFGFMLATISNK